MGTRLNWRRKETGQVTVRTIYGSYFLFEEQEGRITVTFDDTIKPVLIDTCPNWEDAKRTAMLHLDGIRVGDGKGTLVIERMFPVRNRAKVSSKYMEYCFFMEGWIGEKRVKTFTPHFSFFQNGSASPPKIGDTGGWGIVVGTRLEPAFRHKDEVPVIYSDTKIMIDNESMD